MTSRVETSSTKGSENDAAHATALSRVCEREQLPVVRVPIFSLVCSDSPRLAGENMEHVRALAESEASLPPIIVNRATMDVIDGMHRLRAALLRGQADIDVQFFDGNLHDAFVLAVKANIAHGLPLSLADRTAAAARIISSHPQWSDRAIASAAGLTAKTVGTIRRRSTVADAQLNTRIGRDGRVRPLNTAEGRRIASELIADRPDASLREIARAAGISPGTAHDVRERLRHGENPVPSRQRIGKRRKDQLKRDEPATQRKSVAAGARTTITNRASILSRLRQDPSLRFVHGGRVLLRLLHVLSISTTEWEQLIDHVPAHCAPMVSHAARACADVWQEFAEQLERR